MRRRLLALRVHILSDVEGVAGIVKWEQVSGGEPLYEEGRTLYTSEINATSRADVSQIVDMTPAECQIPATGPASGSIDGALCVNQRAPLSVTRSTPCNPFEGGSSS
jgi:hypothetical protein